MEKLVNPTVQGGGGFGNSMAVGGQIGFIGVPGDDNAKGINAGAVQVFLAGQWFNNWHSQSSIYPPVVNSGGQFGRAVDAEPGDDVTPFAVAISSLGVDASDIGRVYMYDMESVTPVYKQTITPADSQPGDWIGMDLDLSDNNLIIGASGDDNANGVDAGAAYVYVRSGATWVPQQKLLVSGPSGSANDRMGRSVAISGNHAALASTNYQENLVNDFGGVVVFKRVGTVWSELQVLTGQADPSGGEEFGSSVAMAYDWLVVGAPGATVDGLADAGAIYLYQFNGSSYVLVNRLTDQKPVAGARLGQNVDMAWSHIAATAPGAKLAVTYREYDGVFLQERRVSDPDAAATGSFADGIAVDNAVLFVGDSGDDQGVTTNRGAVYASENPHPLTSGTDDATVASVILPGWDTYGCTRSATNDGQASCGNSNSSPDVWFKYTATSSGRATARTMNGDYDTVLSVHTAAPGTAANQVVCNDDIEVGDRHSLVSFVMTEGETYLIRVSGYNGASGIFGLKLFCPADINQDSQVDFFDYLDFVAAFDAQTTVADFNGDEQVDFFDYLDFAAAFDTGC
jgi:hypothetical protein